MGRGTWYMGHGVEPWGGDVPRRLSRSQKLPKRIGCRSARLRHGPPCPRPVPERADEGRGRGRGRGRGQTRAEGRRGQTHTAEVDAPWARRCHGGCASEGEATRGESRPSAQGSPRLSAPLSAAQQRLAAWPGVSQCVPACASMCQLEPAGPSSECRRFRREPVCASSPRPRIKAAGLAKSQAKGQDSRHSPKSRPLRAGCNKSLASPEAARAAYNMLRCLCSPLPLPPLLSSPPSPPSSPAEVV
jgi:hypothetical protein